MELIKPNDQLQVSEIDLCDDREWKWPFPLINGLEWCPFWLTVGFWMQLTVDGINDWGNLTGGFGLNWIEI